MPKGAAGFHLKFKGSLRKRAGRGERGARGNHSFRHSNGWRRGAGKNLGLPGRKIISEEAKGPKKEHLETDRQNVL